MKEIYRCLFVCAAFFCLFPNVKAQDSTLSDLFPQESYFEAGLSYLSNSVYLGRHDSSRIPYLTPSFSYYNKSGFYASGYVSYLNSKGISRIDHVEFDAGYIFTAHKFSGEVYAAKDFYNSQSINVKSETEGSLNGSLSYDFGFIEPVLKEGIVIEKTNDYYAEVGLEHSFFLADDNFEITPTFFINASTQNYYNLYYTKRKYSAKNTNRRGPGTIIKAYLPNASEFKIMDYEFSLPLDYSAGKFIFDLNPTLADPVNPNIVVTTTTPPSGISTTKTRTEKLSSIFYWSVSITYSF
ncbi:MAG TPA: hypothetical protein VIJ75_10610 [Hanamia sp.]